MSQSFRIAIEHFISKIVPWDEAYAFPGFSFLAVRKNELLHLIQGRIFLHTNQRHFPDRHFESQNIVVGYFPLSRLGLDYQGLIEKIISSEQISTPLGNFIFPLESSNEPSAQYVPFHDEGLNSGHRIDVLKISGSLRQSYIRFPELDWELKAAPEPYENLNELLHNYSIGTYDGSFAFVEVVAFPVVDIDNTSIVHAESAELVLLAPKSSDRNKCTLGYRALLHGNVAKRSSISTSEINWSEQGDLLRGTCTIDIPTGAVLQCFANYAGFTHRQYWLADPSLSQNPRRAMLEVSDEKLIVLRDFLFEEQKSRKEARDFEIGLAWLLWMLGFNVVHSGATSRTSDAADILAMTPHGHVAVVECTTGHLKSDSKLSKLIERTQAMRKRLDSSGNRHLRLLPVIVTALSRDDVIADLEQAKNLGVVVLTKEDLRAAVDQTLLIQNPDAIFANGEESLRSLQSQLPL